MMTALVHHNQTPLMAIPFDGCRSSRAVRHQDTLLWRKKDRLSEGACGQVYRVTSKQTGQQYAMKLAKPGAEGELLREHDVLRHVKNPHVISSFGYFANGCTHALLLELWDQSLYDWLGGLKDAPSTSESKEMLMQNLKAFSCVF